MTSREPHSSTVARLAQSPAALAFAAQRQKAYSQSITAGAESSERARLPHASGAGAQAIGDTYHTVHGLLSPVTAGTPSMESLNAIITNGQPIWTEQVSSSASQTAPREANDAQAAAKSSDGGLASSQSSEDQFLKFANESQTELDTARAPAPLGNVDASRREEPQLAQLRRRNSSPAKSEALHRLTQYVKHAGYRPGAASVVGVPTRSRPARSPEHKSAAYATTQHTPRTPAAMDTHLLVDQRRVSASEQLLARFHQQRQTRLHQASPTESEFPGKGRSPLRAHRRTDGDSAVSTVHSNVWDEMQELKSHINRIEHNRGYTSAKPHSSGSGERPRTATTAGTTISSSPKVAAGPKSAIVNTRARLENANLHPNLHESLARCRQFVSPAVFRALDSVAIEALELAAGSRNTATGSVYGSAAVNSNDRQSRRKADNICRSLTELCVALIDAQAPQESPKRYLSQQYGQRQSSDFSTPTAMQAMDVAKSRIRDSGHLNANEHFTEDAKPTPSRALDRIQARRASLMINGTPASSPRESSHTTRYPTNEHNRQVTPTDHTPSSRTVTSPQRLHPHQHPIRSDDASYDFRAPSRAATDIGLGSRGKTDRVAALLRNKQARARPQRQQFINTQHANAQHASHISTQASPLTPSSAASFLRSTSRQFQSDSLHPADAETLDDKRAKRRSFNLYSITRASTTPHRALGLRPASMSSQSPSVATDS